MKRVDNLAEDSGSQSNHQIASLTIFFTAFRLHTCKVVSTERKLASRTRSNPSPIPELFDDRPAVTSIEQTKPFLLPYDYFMSVDGRERMRWRFSVMISDQALE